MKPKYIYNHITFRFHFFFRHTHILLHMFSAIGVAWLFITTSCIPAGFAHGLVTYTNEEYEFQETKCIFLSHEGYNHAAFQVSKEK